MRILIAWFCLTMALSLPARAQDSDEATNTPSSDPSADDPHELAKKLSNPIANLISVPFQYNIDFDTGAGEGVRSTLNIQPVVPISITSDWNLILRTILPVTHNEDVIPRSDQFGLGDTLQSFFFAPKHVGSNGIIWGAGPVLLYPTGTDSRLGGEKWGAGPTVVLLKQSGKNTFGILANHVWSFAGSKGRTGISSSFLQPFFSHTTASALTIGLNTESTYDWKAHQWTVPINVTATQLTKMGRQPISVGGGLRYYAEAPRDGPNWGLRFIITLLFPKK